MSGRDSGPIEGVIEQQQRIHALQSEIDAEHKFRFFFVALVFAILSFSIQFPIKNHNVVLNIIEVTSWILLFVSSYYSLKLCSGISLLWFNAILDKINYKKWTDKECMWQSFYVALLLLLLVKILDKIFS